MGSRGKLAIGEEQPGLEAGGKKSGGGGVAGGAVEGVLGPGLMEQGEAVNAEVQEESKFGKSCVREIFSVGAERSSEVATLPGFGFQTKPKMLANLLQSFLPCPTRRQEVQRNLDVQATAK